MDNPLSPILQALQDMPSASTALRGKTRRTAAPGFSAEGSLALDALAVEVRKLGPLAQPLDAASAQALHAACAPAPYGRRERTQVDKTVRDTGQIDAHALTLHWRKGALPRLLADAASRLGLGPLQAHAHKLLVYGPGQFFKPHQDTEKHPGMVATLVLVWPSAHIGGTLQVRHGDAQAQFASQHLQAGGLRWFAFYADCRHEVLPVEAEERVAVREDHHGERAARHPARGRLRHRLGDADQSEDHRHLVARLEVVPDDLARLLRALDLARRGLGEPDVRALRGAAAGGEDEGEDGETNQVLHTTLLYEVALL